MEQRRFIGRAALEKQKAEGIKELLLAYELTDRGVPRQEAKLFKDGQPGGVTTSGTFSPSFQKGSAWRMPPFHGIMRGRI